jgi:tetratricopeptide (TPR) repeat protein
LRKIPSGDFEKFLRLVAAELTEPFTIIVFGEAAIGMAYAPDHSTSHIDLMPLRSAPFWDAVERAQQRLAVRVPIQAVGVVRSSKRGAAAITRSVALRTQACVELPCMQHPAYVGGRPGVTMKWRRNGSGRLAAVIALVLALASIGAPPALAQSAKDAAMKDYEETLVRASAAAASGDNFEAVRLYERAGRVAYNNKLDVDKSALDQKLAAARTARDAQKAGAAAPAATPAPVAAPRGPEAPPSPPTIASVMKEYDQAVAQGDAYASAGEYLLAVKDYERARRLIYNNKLVVDGAGLESKIAAASKAREAPRARSTEIVPPPPPAVPRVAGREELIDYLPERPGKVEAWTLHREGFVVSDMRARTGELAALEANLRRVAEVVLRTPPIHPPKGFDVHVGASLGEIESVEEREVHLAQHMPLPGTFLVSFPSYFKYSPKPGAKVSTTVYTKGELACALRFRFNTPPVPGRSFDDAEGTFLPEPRKDGEIGGQPVYDDMLILAPPGTKFWVPVTTRRVLSYLLPEYRKTATSAEAGAASSRKTQEDILRPEAMARRRVEEAEARAMGGASAEQNAHKLEVMNRRYEEDARKALAAGAWDRNAQQQVQVQKDAEALLASNDAAVLDAPACAAIPAHGGISAWMLVPAGTGGCTPIVTANPKLRNPKLPRSSLQILYVRAISWSTRNLQQSIGMREDPGDCVAVTNVIRALDWKALAALLER